MNPLEMTQADIDHWTEVENEEFRQRYMTAKEVEEKYKISMSRQTQLIKARRVIVVKDSQRVYYRRSYAEWWFGAYTDQQTAKASTREAKKADKKPGRPKKVKGEYEYTLWGSVYKTTNEPRVEMLNWKGYVAAQYPQFYKDGDFKKVIGELIKDQPPELKNALKEIDHVFRKIIAERAK